MLTGTSVRPNAGETWVQALARLNRLFGPLKTVRIYSPTICPGPDDARVSAVTGLNAIPLISFKSWDATSQANFTRLVRGLDRATVTFHHEPEGDPTTDNLAIGRTYTAMRSIVSAAGKDGKIELWHILMGWTVDPKSGRDVNVYLPSTTLAAVDGLGWDLYAGPDTPDGPSRDPVTMFGRCALASKERGKRWGVFETGARVTADTTDGLHADWYSTAMAFARNPRAAGVDADPAVYMTMWNSITGDNDYRIDSLPGVVNIWKGACADEADALSDPTIALKARIAALETQFATACADLARATTDRDAARTEITRLQGALTQLNNTLSQIASLVQAPGGRKP